MALNVGQFFKNLLWSFIPIVGTTISGYKNSKLMKEDVLSSTGLDDLLKGAGLEDGLSGLLSSVAGKYAGTGLTNAEKEANEFSRSERIAAQEWTAQREDTMYQRQVADMQAAGLNPMLAAGGSVHNASPAQPAQSVSPQGGSLSDLLQMFMIPLQMEKMKADIEKTKADTDKSEKDAAKSESESKLNAWTLEWNKRVADIEEESKKAGLDAKRAEGKLFWKQVDEVESNIHYLAEKAKTESERQLALRMKARLDEMSAYEIGELLPYRKNLMDATTRLQKAQASEVSQKEKLEAAQESLAIVEAAYKQHLIDDGYLDAFIKEQQAKAKTAEDKQVIADIAAAIRTNKPLPVDDSLDRLGKASGFVGVILASLANLLDNFNPLTSALDKMSK